MRCAISARLFVIALGLLSGSVIVGDSIARAQVCEDDAGGLVCDEDAGSLEDDAGVDGPDAGGHGGDAGPMSHAGAGSQAGSGGSGSMFDGGIDTESPECSCTADFESGEQGRIHVCTGGNSAKACSRFSCERGTVTSDSCSPSGAELCCVIEDRDLVSVLYDDCTHPNCMAGFESQCQDFGGYVHQGDCSSLLEREHDDSDGDGGGGCAVTGAAPAGDIASVLIALGWWMRRRRKAPSRSA